MPVKFTDNSAKFFRELNNGIIRGIKLGDEILVRNIGSNTPVRTGNLKSKTQPMATIETGDGFSGGVTNNTEYGPEIEYGTIYIPPRAMFRKGGDESAQPVLNIIKKSLPK